MPPPQGTWNPLEGPGDYTTTRTVHSDTYDAIDPLKANLTSKTVFISGASRGLGKAMALSFAKAGASQIAISARSGLEPVAADMKKAATDAGRKEPEVLTLEVEVSSPDSVSKAVEKIGATFLKLDIVINNAGVIGEMKAVADSDPEAWWNTMAINVRGPYLVARACIPLLAKGESKTLITTSSVGALLTTPALSAYQTSKTAVLRLTNFIAAEYAEQGFIVFSIHPGNILTDMAAGLDDKWKAIFTEKPELCADSVVYLSKEYRAWLNGRYINCTWDLPELAEMKERIVSENLLSLTLTTP